MTLEKLSEFYSFLYSKIVGDYTESNEYQKILKCLENGFDILYEKTCKFQKISEDDLEMMVSCLTESEFFCVMQTFRILTATSRMNLNTYFISSLCSKKIFKINIESQNGIPRARRIQFQDNTMTLPNDEEIVKLAYIHPEIRTNLLKFFINRELLEKLSHLTNREIQKIKNLGKILLQYGEKGANAEKSGESAEKIVQNKISGWGIKIGSDFNEKDEKLTSILERKIDVLKQTNQINKSEYESGKQKLCDSQNKREYDLVIPINDPKVIAQIVFYNSNTGSEGKKKTNQNIDSTTLLDDVIPNRTKHLKNLVLIDGPGWIDMIGQLQKNFEQADDFFQIRTVDTKLKNILNKLGLIFPIDIEITILELAPSAYKISIKKIIDVMSVKHNEQWKEDEIRKRIFTYCNKSENSDIVKIDPTRIENAKKFLVLEKLMNIDSKNPEFKYSITIPSSKSPKISDVDILNELKRVGFNESEINSIITNLEAEGTIIINNV